jgi:hypothetical protein
MKEIKVLLLQGGVEVIAEIEPIRGLALSGGDGPITGYRLNKPFRVLAVPIPMQTPQGIQVNVTPQLIPLVGAVIRNAIEIKPTDIIGEPLEANKQFESAYIRMTTGLELAS